MGTVKAPPPVAFFSSVIFAEGELLPEVEAGLGRLLGSVSERTESFSFSESDYYEAEMGPSLGRRLLLFEAVLGREMLPELKLAANGIEAATAVGGRRRVNVDPGYIALEHVVLATTKGYAHRVYLGGGVYADLTLIFENGSYRPLSWTYPDYGDERMIGLLNRWRERYKGLLRCQRA